MAIKEVAYNIKNSGGYDKYYFETSTNVVVDLEQGKSLKQILTEINGRTTANQTSITNNFNQNEYQLPIVVGTQLRLTKSNTSKRFFVQLANTVNGAITISTDSGATSKPLRDVSGVAVTSLEKGFAEIVEDTTFFTLRNRGVSATDLQALITAANEVEANSRVLREQYITAVNQAEPISNLPITATWLDVLNQIPNITNGRKRMASGTVDFSTNFLNFIPRDGGNPFNLRYCEFQGLSFAPSRITLFANNTTNNYIVDYIKEQNGLQDLLLINSVNNGSGSTVGYNIKLDGNVAFVSNTGFRLPISATPSPYSWIAYE